MRLVFPVFYGQKVYTDVEIKRPTAETLAITSEFVEDGKYFQAICFFVSRCIVNISNESESIDSIDQIKSIMREAMWKSIYHCAIQILLLNPGDDGIEGIYRCPRCGNEIICELNDGIDTRDFIHQLEVNYYECSNYFDIELEQLVELKLTNAETEIIEKIQFRYPTITDYIEAEAKHSIKNSSRLQMEVYSKSVIGVNNKEKDKKWRDNYANLLIKRMLATDISKISKVINKIGINQNVMKTCGKCGKTFHVEVNTNNFFASGLRSID